MTIELTQTENAEILAAVKELTTQTDNDMTEQLDPKSADVLDIIREALKYYHAADVVLSDFTSVQTLRAAYENQPGGTYWFSPDTLRAFGSRNLHMTGAGILCETQTKYPGGTMYAVTAWIYSDEERLHPVRLEYFHTLRGAEKFGKLAADVWRSAVLSGANLTGARYT